MCIIDGCQDKTKHRRGMCNRHYLRATRHGDPFVADADKSLDHKKPLSRGGDHTIENLQLAHLGCNQRKSNRFVCA